MVTLLAAGAGAGVAIATSGHEEGGAPAIEVPVVERTFSLGGGVGEGSGAHRCGWAGGEGERGLAVRDRACLGEERSDGTRRTEVRCGTRL